MDNVHNTIGGVCWVSERDYAKVSKHEWRFGRFGDIQTRGRDGHVVSMSRMILGVDRDTRVYYRFSPRLARRQEGKKQPYWVIDKRNNTRENISATQFSYESIQAGYVEALRGGYSPPKGWGMTAEETAALMEMIRKEAEASSEKKTRIVAPAPAPVAQAKVQPAQPAQPVIRPVPTQPAQPAALLLIQQQPAAHTPPRGRSEPGKQIPPRHEMKTEHRTGCGHSPEFMRIGYRPGGSPITLSPAGSKTASPSIESALPIEQPPAFFLPVSTEAEERERESRRVLIEGKQREEKELVERITRLRQALASAEKSLSDCRQLISLLR